jgi:outer membrane protein insertion porin family/translocation and assembly module TamA
VARPLAGSGRLDGERLLHPRKRLYAGGASSVRGYMENQLGPRVLRAGRGDLLAAGCTDATIADGTCDPTPVADKRLEARPVGGGALLEASGEWRYPVQRKMIAVGFVDAGWLGEAGVRPAGFGVGGAWDVTPGAGLRYRSPLGVIRLDLGVRLRGSETLPVLTTTSDDPRTARVVRLGDRAWDPTGDRNAVGRILGHTTLHFSMGQAF